MTHKKFLCIALVSLVIILKSNTVISSDFYEDFTFSSFGQKNLSELDLNKFSKLKKINSGRYIFDIYINNKFLYQKNILLIDNNNGSLNACIDEDIFNLINLNVNKFEVYHDENNCVEMHKSIKSSNVELDTSNLRVYLSIPQAYFNNTPKGYIPEELFEPSITALKLDYNMNSYYQHDNTSYTPNNKYGAFFSLNSSINIFDWRIHNFSTARWSNSHYDGWDSIRTYAQKEIFPLKSQLTIGETFTSGELFSSIGFRGISLSTDDRMLPTSQTGYAPVVRGVARSQARVTIEQNGYSIYEIDVPPGEFSINDLYATGYDGDLKVKIVESDGRIQEYSVPYSATPRLLREKHLRYSVTLGEIRGSHLTDSSLFGESTLQYGLSNYLTAYTGLQILGNNKFQSELLGLAINTAIGAISFDTTWSHNQTTNESKKKNGYSIRGVYSRNFVETGTNFAFTSYRYSSKGYSDINSTLTEHNNRDHRVSEKNKLQITLSQKLIPQWGNINLSGAYTEHWNGQQEHNYQLGYNNNFNNLYYSLTLAQSHTKNSSRNSQLFININAPLGTIGNSQTVLTNTLSFSESSRPSMQVGITGNNIEQNIDYRISTNLSGIDDNKLDGSLTWQSPFNNINTNASLSKKNKRAAVNIKGGALIHKNGITLAPNMGETIALIHIPNGRGSKVGSNTVNKAGFGIATNLSPYKKNTVTIYPGDTSLNLEIERPIRQITPKAGSVVAITFDTQYGYSLLIKPIFKEEAPYIPMGSIIVDEQNNEVGVVGQKQYIFARVSNHRGRLSLYSISGNPICSFNYEIPEGLESLSNLTLLCE